MSSDDIAQAFAHPDERARATQAPGPLPDRISLRDHVVEVEIGAFQAERGVTQRLAFNVVVEVTPPDAPVEDDVDRILSYDRVTEAIAGELSARRFDLLETLAEGIAGRILEAPQALRVFVRIEKLDRGPGALGVEIVRTAHRAAPAAPAARAAGPAPLIACIGLAQRHDPALGRFLGLLAAAEAPVLLTTDMAPLPPAGPEAATARRNIALLAADQGAWLLAGMDPRLVVAASRTEIDWALANDRLAVWAPSKAVLAAVHPPEPVADSAARASWIARELGARALMFVGTNPPAPAGVQQLTARLDDPALPKLPQSGNFGQ